MSDSVSKDVAEQMVCVVIEDGDYLYGVFVSEKAARKDYGEIRTPVEFIMCRVFGESDG